MMTNERAIELLHRISDSQFDGEYGDERREALEKAVRALEQNLVKESGDLVQDLVKDCISRQQAIDAVNKLVEWYKEKWHESRPTSESVIDVLNDLPSAQPEPSQVARDICTILENEQDMRVILKNAQPERKKGKWITVLGRLGNEVECNQCHSVFWYWMGNYRFCPSCGARMEGEANERYDLQTGCD